MLTSQAHSLAIKSICEDSSCDPLLTLGTLSMIGSASISLQGLQSISGPVVKARSDCCVSCLLMLQSLSLHLNINALLNLMPFSLSSSILTINGLPVTQASQVTSCSGRGVLNASALCSCFFLDQFVDASCNNVKCTFYQLYAILTHKFQEHSI